MRFFSFFFKIGRVTHNRADQAKDKSLQLHQGFRGGRQALQSLHHQPLLPGHCNRQSGQAADSKPAFEPNTGVPGSDLASPPPITAAEYILFWSSHLQFSFLLRLSSSDVLRSNEQTRWQVVCSSSLTGKVLIFQPSRIMSPTS